MISDLYGLWYIWSLIHMVSDIPYMVSDIYGFWYIWVLYLFHFPRAAIGSASKIYIEMENWNSSWDLSSLCPRYAIRSSEVFISLNDIVDFKIDDDWQAFWFHFQLNSPFCLEFHTFHTRRVLAYAFPDWTNRCRGENWWGIQSEIQSKLSSPFQFKIDMIIF